MCVHSENSAVSYLKNVDQLLVLVRREVDFHSWVCDSLHLCEYVADVTERCLSVHQIIENATERPHVTPDADLQRSTE